MFEKILIAISSEFYSKEILEKGAFLARCFGSRVTIVYIIEEKTIAQAEKRSDTFRTRFEKEETKNVIIKGQQQTANVIIFFDAKAIFKEKGIIPDFKIVEGEFSAVIEQEVQTQQFDLVLLGYSKECMLKYRILDEIAVPLWVVGTSGDHLVLGVCSNLTPNQGIPPLSKKIAECFGWDLHLVYIVDDGEPMGFDEAAQRFVRRSVPQLRADGQRFVEEMEKKGITAQMVSGGVVESTLQTARRLNAGLVVIGQEQKRYDILGLSVRSLNHKLAEKSRYSMVFLR
jgi:nucleotide-binding universal stress UspA family protein